MEETGQHLLEESSIVLNLQKFLAIDLQYGWVD
jgi:hypothetical protein